MADYDEYKKDISPDLRAKNAEVEAQRATIQNQIDESTFRSMSKEPERTYEMPTKAPKMRKY
jgi:hypothetical protein